MVSFMVYMLFVSIGVLPVLVLNSYINFFSNYIALFVLGFFGSAFSLILALLIKSELSIFWQLFSTIIGSTAFFYIFTYIYAPLDDLLKISKYMSLFVKTWFGKICSLVVGLLGSVGSIYSIIGYHKSADDIVNNILFPISVRDITDSISNEVNVLIPDDGFISTVLLNPVNLFFLLMMFYLFFVDVKSYKTESHKDFRSSISSLGVLGTFFGVFLGLLHFDTNDIERSIPILLNGLKTAFFTSVIGISLSTILSIYRSSTLSIKNKNKNKNNE